MSTRHFVLATIGIMLASLLAAATTITLASMSVKATTQEDEDDDDDRDGDGALTQTITQNKDGEERVKHIESNEHSENAAVKITKSSYQMVEKEDRSDNPARTGKIVFEEDGEEVKEITQESAPQSSKATNTISPWTVTHSSRSSD